jgi:hypothetical protein
VADRIIRSIITFGPALTHAASSLISIWNEGTNRTSALSERGRSSNSNAYSFSKLGPDQRLGTSNADWAVLKVVPRATQPPSTTIAVPVTHSESSLAR